MSLYENGKIPKQLLVVVDDAGHLTTPATAARWRAFVADAQRTCGWTPKITDGVNAYRDLETQIKYREELGIMAAVPGTSSHGGTYAGAYTKWIKFDAMAFDVGNWSDVGFDKFKMLAERNGFAVNVVVPTELWHMTDFAPWTMPAGGSDKPFEPETKYTIEEDEMANPIAYIKGNETDAVYALYTTAGANNAQVDSTQQGYVYAARRYVEGGEFQAVEALGVKVITIKQSDFDLIPKVWGSK